MRLSIAIEVSSRCLFWKSFTQPLTVEVKKELLQKLIEAEQFEQFLHHSVQSPGFVVDNLRGSLRGVNLDVAPGDWWLANLTMASALEYAGYDYTSFKEVVVSADNAYKQASVTVDYAWEAVNN